MHFVKQVGTNPDRHPMERNGSKGPGKQTAITIAAKAKKEEKRKTRRESAKKVDLKS